MSLKASLQRFLSVTGKSGEKVVAVFAAGGDDARAMVQYLNRECPHLPIFLFTQSAVPSDCARRCALAVVCPDSGELLVSAQKVLWPYSVALTAVAWTRRPGSWALKWGPFLIPPFRVLVMNEHGGFFSPSPSRAAGHLYRRIRDTATRTPPRVQDLYRALRLLAFMSLAVNCLAFARRAYRRMEVSLPLHLPPAAPRGEAIAEFRYEMKHWDREALLRLIADPGVRFIHFLQGNARAGTSGLLPLFDDPRTFAVARQSEHRQWQPMMLLRAPFRHLEPGCATRTMAPAGRSMLVDRAKLDLLGLPEALVPGTAWFLLFTKAASAGWRSYTVGSPGRTFLCPDWPYEEGEFVTRLRYGTSPHVKGMREAALSRGNIVFPTAGAKPFRGLPRVLVVSPYLPYPLSHGGAVRIHNLCRALSDRVDFILACFREKEDTPAYGKLLEIFRDVRVLDADEPASGDRSLPGQVRRHPSASLQALIAELCQSSAIDIVQVEYTHMAGFGAAAGRTPRILVEHDLTYSLYHQLAGQFQTASAWAEYNRWLHFERDAFARYDSVWVMSEQDRAAAIEAGSRAETTFVVANGVDTRHFLPMPASSAAGEVFYAGSFRHLPNIIGFKMLLNEVMPRVWQRFPDAGLRVVAGGEPARYWRELTGQPYPAGFDPRVAIHSFVADLRPLYARASLVVVPLPVSAGTNVKVMEAMACGKPVVTTPAGCRGLDLQDGYDALIREGAAAFAGAIADLLAKPRLRETIACNARRTVEDRFDWQDIAGRAFASYQKLLSRRSTGTIAWSGHSDAQIGVSE